jgi:hypothetical protein
LLDRNLVAHARGAVDLGEVVEDQGQELRLARVAEQPADQVLVRVVDREPCLARGRDLGPADDLFDARRALLLLERREVLECLRELLVPMRLIANLVLVLGNSSTICPSAAASLVRRRRAMTLGASPRKKSLGSTGRPLIESRCAANRTSTSRASSITAGPSICASFGWSSRLQGRSAAEERPVHAFTSLK